MRRLNKGLEAIRMMEGVWGRQGKGGARRLCLPDESELLLFWIIAV